MAWIETNSDYSRLIKYQPTAEAFLHKERQEKKRKEKRKCTKEGEGDSLSAERFLVKDELINSWRCCRKGREREVRD